MTNDNINLIVEKFHDKISEKQVSELKNKLSDTPDEMAEKFTAVEVKSPAKTTILSAVLGLFGAGSFYLGKIRRGIIKVIFNILVPFTVGMIFLFWLAPLNFSYLNESNNIYSVVKTMNLDNAKIICTELKDIKLSSAVNKKITVKKTHNNLVLKFKDCLTDLNANLNELDILINEIESETDDAVKAEKITEKQKYEKEISEFIDKLISSTKSAIDSYSFIYQFINLYFCLLLSVDGIIILGYWIGHTFQERNECFNLNYNKIIAIK